MANEKLQPHTRTVAHSPRKSPRVKGAESSSTRNTAGRATGMASQNGSGSGASSTNPTIMQRGKQAAKDMADDTASAASRASEAVTSAARAATDMAGDKIADGAAAAKKTVKKKVKPVAKAAAKRAKSAANKASRTAQNAADDISNLVADEMHQAVDETTRATQNRVEGYLQSLGSAIDQGRRQLDADGYPTTAAYADYAAGQVRAVADNFDTSKVKVATDRVESFMRERPLITVGSAVLLGFAAYQMLKSPRTSSAGKSSSRRKG